MNAEGSVFRVLLFVRDFLAGEGPRNFKVMPLHVPQQSVWLIGTSERAVMLCDWSRIHIVSLVRGACRGPKCWQYYGSGVALAMSHRLFGIAYMYGLEASKVELRRSMIPFVFILNFI